MAVAAVYVWEDPDGSQHFADTPPPPGVLYEHRESVGTSVVLYQKARELAIMWFHASPYGGRCDMADMRRIERLYEDLWAQARRELHRCKEGQWPSCRALGIPLHLAVLNSEQSLQSYLPPGDIRYMRESGYDGLGRSWKCR